MNSLPIRILTAVITFTIGVGFASVWLMRWNPNISPVTINTPAARLEMVFVLDTTGSMGGLLDGAKQRIWGIVNEVMQESHPSVKIGLVAYRDHGDEYITQVLPLTEDLDKVYATLMDYKPAGGGDTPEDVQAGLADGVYKAGWSPAAPDVARIIFLVGDAPPHDDADETSGTVTIASQASQNGIIVNTIQCGSSTPTRDAWQAIARNGHGQYFAIAENGGVQTVATPYDEQMSTLVTRLSATFLPYGFGAGAAGEIKRAEVAREVGAIEARIASTAPSSAKAERAVNKAISSEAYVGDLLQSLENGSVKLEDVNPVELPADLQSLSPAARQQEIESRLAWRRDLRAQILELSKARDTFINAERKKRGGGAGFDVVVGKALKEQITKEKIK